jgi:predicted dehydrogenase
MIRWGILGTGRIAGEFAEGLSSVSDARLVAVGSRTAASAARFAETWGAEQVCGSYEALAAADIDVIYVATPHPMHYENTLLCLRAGKHVLCEKPFTMNAREAAHLIAEARERGLFLMEAMWTRFLPVWQAVKHWLDEGVIGEIREIDASFRFCVDEDPASRLFAPELGGGALLDVGIYPVSLAHWLAGKPQGIHAEAEIGGTGVDYASSYEFDYGNGVVGRLDAAIRRQHKPDALITGTRGTIRVHGDWWVGDAVTLTVGGQTRTESFPLEGNGYNYEADAVGRCLAAGETECPVMSLDESLTLMNLLDEIRGLIGLHYPQDERPLTVEAGQ